MSKPKIIVGSAWWSDTTPSEWLIGDAIMKEPAFFGLWLYLVRRYIQPDRIVVLDINAPVKPAKSLRDQVTWVELDKNYGHPNDVRVGKVRTKYAGCTRGELFGAMYALCHDADIYCYLEQDCVIRGDGFLEKAIAGREPTIIIGPPPINGVGLGGRVAGPAHQISLIIVGRGSLERFITSRMRGPETDGELSPERKMARDCAPFELLAIPYGRSKPVDFNLPCYYAQHFSRDDLVKFLASENRTLADFGFSQAAS
jgi:hypothetical protein